MTENISLDMSVIDSKALEVRWRLHRYANVSPEVMYGEFDITKGAIGAIIGGMNKALDGDTSRYLICGWLFNDNHTPMRSGDLTDEQWYALYKWVGFWKNEDDDKWYTREGFNDEVLAVYSAAIRDLSTQGPEAQRAAGRDPQDIIDNLVELGGKVTAMVDAAEEEAPTYDSKPTVIPKSLRNTRFGSQKLTEDKERRLLTELGYDADDDPLMGF